MILKDILPCTSFISDDAKLIKDGEIIWKNKALSPTRPDLEYAFVIPNSNIQTIDKTNKMMLGERYGGQGLGNNGGGVRCGLIDDVQVKGYGANGLAGTGTDYFHSYGGASLHEGLLEAIWGEVINSVLPYGSARCFSIIGTNSKVPVKFPKTGGPTRTKQVLILRQPTIRPAHFMRAIFFKTKSNVKITHDAIRTANAIRNSPLAFMKAGLLQDHASCSVSAIDDALISTFQRHAHQIAVARARRIMHGSLTSSNISIDGRWLDFGSISTVSDFGRIIIPRGAPDFLNEEAVFLDTAKNLFFYFTKYFPQFSKKTELSATSLFSEMTRQISAYWETDLLKLCGFSSAIIEKISHENRKAMFDVLSEIRCQGNTVPFTILSVDNDYDPVMPKQTGSYHLNSCLKAIAKADNSSEAEANLAGLLPHRLSQKLINIYFKCLGEIKFSSAQDLRNIDFVRLNALRLNSSPTKLYRTVLYPEIERIERQENPTQKFVDDLIAYGKFKLADIEEFSVTSVEKTQIEINIAGASLNKKRISVKDVLKFTPVSVWE